MATRRYTNKQIKEALAYWKKQADGHAINTDESEEEQKAEQAELEKQ